jgi:hypothetical protein
MTSIVTTTNKSAIGTEAEKLAKKLERYEKNKQYMREYSKNRRLNDPEYRLRQNEATRLNNKKKYETSEEYRKHQIDSYKNRYAKYREAYIKSIESSED